MNIRQAVDFNSLATRSPITSLKEKRTAVEITSRIFSMAEAAGVPIVSDTPSGWKKEWLASENFYLMNLPTHLASVPTAPEDHNKVLASLSAAGDGSMEPIVVDFNKNRLGQSANTTFFPQVIVVDGRHRHRAIELQGRERVRAWVGEVAAAHLGLLHADHQIGSSELQDKLREKLQESYPRPTREDGLPDYSSEYKYAFIQEVYPLENYFVYKYDNELYKQGYSVDAKTRSVTFAGKKRLVVQRYVNAGAAKPRQSIGPLEAAMQVHASVPFPKIKANGMGGPGASSLGTGSGANPLMKEVKPLTAATGSEAGGYKGYGSASKVMSDKTKGASNSEMRSQLRGTGYDGYKSATKTQSDKTKGASNSELAQTLKGAAVVKKIVTKFRKSVQAGYKPKMDAVAPPGMEKTVKGLKKHVGTSSAFKLAWYMHDRKSKKK